MDKTVLCLKALPSMGRNLTGVVQRHLSDGIQIRALTQQPIRLIGYALVHYKSHTALGGVV